MDLFGLIFLSCVSVLCGMILTVFIQYCVLLKYFKTSSEKDPSKKPIIEAYSLPETLKKCLDHGDYNENNSVAVNFMLQFLFHELRYSDNVKRWLYKKLSLEFDELLTKTTTGKFFEAVTIRDMHLGSQFPDIKNLTVENVEMDKVHGHIDVLNVCVQLDYSGNFLLSVDAKMKFGKTAYLSIKVKRVSGLARLQFTRLPYTHWSFSFYSDPLLELAVESQFQGRQLQSNITSLIINQIKKAIKRKHTLPNYKIRYKPFFNKTDPGQLDTDDYEVIPQGILYVTCMEVTRLSTKIDTSTVYCTFTVDAIPWVRLSQHQNDVHIIMDLTILKNRQQQLGVVFKQEMENKTVSVETIVANSPAASAGLCPGDLLISIDSKPISNMTQVAKIIKSLTTNSFCVRIKRTARNYVFSSKNAVPKSESTDNLDMSDADKKGEKTESSDKRPKSMSMENKLKNADKLPKLLSTSNENVSKLAQTIGNFSLKKRKSSIERNSNDGSSKSTPTASSCNTPQHIRTPSNLFSKNKSIAEDIQTPQIVESDDFISSQDIECYETPSLEMCSVISFDDQHSFCLRDTDKYLNINIWAKNKTEDILLGYANIPLVHVLNECCNSMVGHYINMYSFLPPDNITSQSHPLGSHSGFEQCFCYGDVLLSFTWVNEDISNMKRKLSTTETSSKDSLKLQHSKHNFIRMQFHRITHCDFCSKKIWLKDAVQCLNCNLCCHKKCVLKCQTSTICATVEARMEESDFTQPEIKMTEVDDDHIKDNDSDKCTDYNGMSNGLKRVNSANSLAIPGSHLFSNSQSRSLPPSPQHTPSRKQSITNLNPFVLCPALLDACYLNSSDPSMADSIAQIIEQLLHCNQNDNLMDMAKETGIQSYSSIPHEHRTEKINILMTELKKTLDNMTMEHSELLRQLAGEENPVEKARVAFLVGQADAKVHALSVLMLHYCSGLQQTQEKIV